MPRAILHSDIDCCYAAIECQRNPAIRDKPVAVVGDQEKRHGIVLAKNYIAKGFGVKTGQAIWEAQRQCPGLVLVNANHKLYINVTNRVRRIYADYTDQIQNYGIDESWLDCSRSLTLFGSAEQIARTIQSRVWQELGITVSIGVSFNKIFSKLGSDLNKPNGIAVITQENYRDVVWPLPVGDLLFVGRKTEIKLNLIGIRTIGQLAQAKPEHLKRLLGKWGEYLWVFANGHDNSPVEEINTVKSVGNSITTPRDVMNLVEVKVVLMMLADSVAARLREQGLKGRTVQISIRDRDLQWIQRQGKLIQPSYLAEEVTNKALELFTKNYPPPGGYWKAIRSLGISMCDLVPADCCQQLTIFSNEEEREKRERLAVIVDDLRRRYGQRSVYPAILLTDQQLSEAVPKDDHTVHPMPYSS